MQSVERCERDVLPKMQLVIACLDSEAILPNPEDGWDYPQYDMPKIDQIAQSIDFESEDDNKEKVVIPENYPWQQKLKKSLRDCINLYYKLGLVDKSLLITAAKVADPNNIIPSLETYGCEGLFYISEEAEQTAVPPDWIPAIPRSKQERNGNFEIRVNPGRVAEDAWDLMVVADQERINISTEQALAMATFRVAAHEQGHAYDVACFALGNSTFEKAKTLPMQGLEGLLRRGDIVVHKEHFARSLEQIVFREALLRIWGASPEETAALMRGYYSGVSPEVHSAIETYFHSVTNHGIRVDEVRTFEHRIRNDIYGLYWYGVEGCEYAWQYWDILPYTGSICRYRLPCYTLDEGQLLLNLNN